MEITYPHHFYAQRQNVRTPGFFRETLNSAQVFYMPLPRLDHRYFVFSPFCFWPKKVHVFQKNIITDEEPGKSKKQKKKNM